MVILLGMTHKVGPKGQVVLPKPLRSELGIQAGDEVLFERAGGGIRVWKAPESNDLWGSLPAAEIDPLRLLMAEKRSEREREDRGLPERGR
jgi:AbrB family looped-hinge helix DNA binding protein